MYFFQRTNAEADGNRWTYLLQVLLVCEVYVIGEAIKLHGIHSDENHPSPRRRLMQAMNWKHSILSMAHCISDSDCLSFGILMTCIDDECGCDTAHVLLDNNFPERGCYPKVNLFQTCIVSDQCFAMNRNTYCNRNNRCTCSPGYYFDGRDCIMRYDANLKAQEVYKAAVVAAACFIVAVVGIFVACILRRSFCRRDHNVQHASSSSSDVFIISDEIAALRAVDKPPSYEEVLQIERTFYGIPPPEYSFAGDSNVACNQDTVAICEVTNHDSENQNPTVHNIPTVYQTSDSSATVPSNIASAAVCSEQCRTSTDNYSISAAASPVTQRRNVNSSPISSLFSCSTPLQQSLRVLGLPLSASAPSSPSVASHMPHPPTKRGFLQRLSSLKLYSRTRDVPSQSTAPRNERIPTISPNVCPDIMVTASEGVTSTNMPDIQSSNNHGVSYDNPAFIDERK